MDQEHYFAFIREEANHEIARLKTLLQEPRITEEDRGVTLAMLQFYEELSGIEDGPFPQSSENMVLSQTKSVRGRKSKPAQRESSSRKKAQAA